MNLSVKDVRYKADINVIKKIIGKCQNIRHNYTKRSGFVN